MMNEDDFNSAHWQISRDRQEETAHHKTVILCNTQKSFTPCSAEAIIFKDNWNNTFNNNILAMHKAWISAAMILLM